MLELLSSGLISIWLELSGVELRQQYAGELLIGAGIPGFVWPGGGDPRTKATLEQYLKALEAKGVRRENQGIWLQTTQGELLANHQGNIPRSAASITKVATSLAALWTWPLDYQFETLIAARGQVVGEVLAGDLVIVGGYDPLFVWEEAIALGNALNRLGIRRVTGNLVITGHFLMNGEDNEQKSGELLKQALHSQLWSAEITDTYNQMSGNAQKKLAASAIPKPQVAIAGQVIVSKQPPNQTTPLIRHYSLPLVELLKLMNIYSSNTMAEILTAALGGVQVVKKIAAAAAGVPPEQIQLVNGSGLGEANRISPRAACGLLMAIQNYLSRDAAKPGNPTPPMNLADLFPIAGIDGGTLEDRNMPAGSVVKTGTLWNVSALGGVLPTRDRGLVWFAILNGGGDDIWGFREGQDQLLHQLVKQWGVSPEPFPQITRHWTSNQELIELGAPSRNEFLWAR